MAVSGTVVNHSHVLQLQGVGRIACQCSAQGVVIGNDTEHAWVAWAGQLGVGCRAGDERHAAVVKDFGRRNRHARVQNTGHGSDFFIAQLLRCSGALLGICGVVFGDHFKFDLLAADGHTLGIQVLNRHAHAVDVVFAIVGLRARQRAHRADLDHHLLRLSGDRQACNYQGDRCFDTFIHCVVLHQVHQLIATGTLRGFALREDLATAHIHVNGVGEILDLAAYTPVLVQVLYK